MRSTTPEGPSVDIRVAGLLVRLCFSPQQEEFAQHLRTLWSHVVVEAGEESPLAVLRYATAGTPEASAKILPDDLAASYSVSGDVTRSLIRSRLGADILLHSGVVEHDRLGLVLLVGASGAGKSTATVQLGSSGTYLSDELAIIDPADFSVTAYPKPVSRVQTPGSGLSKHDLPPSELGLTCGVSGGAPDLVVLLDRIDGGDGAEITASSLRRVPLAEALPLVIEQSSSLWVVPGGLDRLAELLTSTGGLLRVRYREAAELEDLLASPPPALGERWDVIDPPGADDTVRPGHASGPDGAGSPDEAEGPDEAENPDEADRPDDADNPDDMGSSSEGDVLRVAPFTQALRLDTGVVVMRERAVIFLPSLVGLVWDELREHGGLDPVRLERTIVESIGEDPDSASHIAEVLDVLQREGWVRPAER